MNIDVTRLQESLCGQMCADVRIAEGEDRLAITTPFYFPDGDPYVLYADEIPGGRLRLSDLGHTFMQLSYENDIDAIRKGNRGKLLAGVLASSGISEEDGELYIDVDPSEVSTAVFRLGQAITSVSDLTFLNRARVESTFIEDLYAALQNTVGSDKVQREYEVPGISSADKYIVDFRIPGKNSDFFVFGVSNKDKARLTTVVLEHLRGEQIEFESLLVFADQSIIPRDDLARLSNVGGEMVASLDAQEDLKRKIVRRAA